MRHVVLLGDSIFDNAAYVPDRPPVIEQVRRGLPRHWKATLAAVDGATIEEVAAQLPLIPTDATHLILSVGGNDALAASAILREPAATVGDALEVVAETLERFRLAYIAMLRGLLALGKPLANCTIYDAIPILGNAERAALAAFNDVITRAAIQAEIPLVDLRVICDHPDDYSPVSPIEPSVAGGAKIADAICHMVSTHDFAARGTIVYT